MEDRKKVLVNKYLTMTIGSIKPTIKMKNYHIGWKNKKNDVFFITKIENYDMIWIDEELFKSIMNTFTLNFKTTGRYMIEWFNESQKMVYIDLDASVFYM